MGGVQVNFPLQIPQVLVGPAMVLGNDLVTRTVITKGFAERDMDINRQWQSHGGRPRAALLKRLHVVVGGKSLDKPVRRRIRGVAWAVPVKSAKQIRGNNAHKQESSGLMNSLPPNAARDLDMGQTQPRRKGDKSNLCWR